MAIGLALEPLEREAARERLAVRSENFTQVNDTDKGKALDKVAFAVGMSRPTYEKAKEVVEAAEQEPEKYGDLAEQMDKKGNVNGAHKKLRQRRKEEAKQAIPDDLPEIDDRYRLITGALEDVGSEIETGSVDIIITDPPYPQEYLPVYETLARFGARVLKPGGSMLVMIGQSYLPDVLALMTPYVRYNWTLAYLTPGGQSAQLWQRKVNTFWKPVLWFVNGDYAGDWIGDVAQSMTNDNDKRFHNWGQSESGMADLIERFTYPGQLVCDPFGGAMTTGVVAVGKNRLFIGIDNDPECIRIGRDRLTKEVCHARS